MVDLEGRAVCSARGDTQGGDDFAVPEGERGGVDHEGAPHVVADIREIDVPLFRKAGARERRPLEPKSGSRN
jgi:hypothetical protein